MKGWLRPARKNQSRSVGTVERCIIQIAASPATIEAASIDWPGMSGQLDRLTERLSAEVESSMAEAAPPVAVEDDELAARLAPFVEQTMDFLDGVTPVAPTVEGVSYEDRPYALRVAELLRAFRAHSAGTSRETREQAAEAVGRIKSDMSNSSSEPWGEPIERRWSRRVPKRRVERTVSAIVERLIVRLPGVSRYGSYVSTMLALAFTSAAAWLIALGHFRIAAAALALAVPWEVLDAELAIKSPGPRGRVFMDFVSDRLGDIVVFLAIAWTFRVRDPNVALLASGVLALALLGSYIRAEASALRFDGGGSFGRAERLILLILGLAIGWVPQMLIAGGIVAAATCIHRFLAVWRQSRALDVTALAGLEWSHKRTVVQLVTARPGWRGSTGGALSGDDAADH